MIRTIKAFDIKGKNILLRVDFNVPMDEGCVSNNFRIKTALPTIKSCIEGFSDESKNETVVIHFKTSTGGGIQLSGIKFFDSNNNVLTVLSSEKPETNPDESKNNLDLGRGSETIDKTYDNNEATKWWSYSTLGSVKFTLNGVPNYYTFTTANDNNPNNRTPVSR